MGGFTMALALFLLSSASVMVQLHAITTPPPIFVFGDSLADVGNNNHLPNGVRADHPPYGIDFPGGVATGRFTNGYNMIDVLAQKMGFEQSPPPAHSTQTVPFDQYITRGVNFASAGSGILIDCGSIELTAKCYSMRAQIKSFASFVGSLSAALGVIRAKQLIAESVFIIFTGYKDVSGFLLDELVKNPLFPGEAYVANVSFTFGTQLQELYSLGARKIAFLRVPLGGVNPVARAVAVSSPSGLDIVATMNAYSLQIDVAITALVAGLGSTLLPEMKYSLLNFYAVAADVFNRSAEFGWKNVASPCCGQVSATPVYPYVEVVECTSGASFCSNRSDYVFWDSENPAQAAIEYGGECFYNGEVPTYAFPMNLRQLVEYGSSAAGVHAGVITTPNPDDVKAHLVEDKSLQSGVVAGDQGSSAVI